MDAISLAKLSKMQQELTTFVPHQNQQRGEQPVSGKSHHVFLEGLEISPGKIIPSFSPSHSMYKIIVPTNTKEICIHPRTHNGRITIDNRTETLPYSKLLNPKLSSEKVVINLKAGIETTDLPYNSNYIPKVIENWYFLDIFKCDDIFFFCDQEMRMCDHKEYHEKNGKIKDTRQEIPAISDLYDHDGNLDTLQNDNFGNHYDILSQEEEEVPSMIPRFSQSTPLKPQCHDKFHLHQTYKDYVVYSDFRASNTSQISVFSGQRVYVLKMKGDWCLVQLCAGAHTSSKDEHSSPRFGRLKLFRSNRVNTSSPAVDLVEGYIPSSCLNEFPLSVHQKLSPIGSPSLPRKFNREANAANRPDIDVTFHGASPKHEECTGLSKREDKCVISDQRPVSQYFQSHNPDLERQHHMRYQSLSDIESAKNNSSQLQQQKPMIPQTPLPRVSRADLLSSDVIRENENHDGLSEECELQTYKQQQSQRNLEQEQHYNSRQCQHSRNQSQSRAYSSLFFASRCFWHIESLFEPSTSFSASFLSSNSLFNTLPVGTPKARPWVIGTFAMLQLAMLIVCIVRQRGVAPFRENPLGGAGVDVLRQMGGIWVPDVIAGHIHLLATALFVPVGILRFLIDLIIMLIVGLPIERTHGSRVVLTAMLGV